MCLHLSLKIHPITNKTDRAYRGTFRFVPVKSDRNPQQLNSYDILECSGGPDMQHIKWGAKILAGTRIRSLLFLGQTELPVYFV